MKELVGPDKNGGREWCAAGQPVQVNSHDFLDRQNGKAIPYGIYDVTADVGWVTVGTDHHTAAFAVASIRRWWHARGSSDYPYASRLLITADAGGCNGYRVRAWKLGLGTTPRSPTPARRRRRRPRQPNISNPPTMSRTETCCATPN